MNINTPAARLDARAMANEDRALKAHASGRPAAAIAAAPKPAAHIAHQHTISRDLAHKRRLENVYVTSLSPADPAASMFQFGAFVPQSNAFINDMRLNAQDVTLSIIEIGRQIGIALSHEFLGAAPRQAFVLDRMRFDARPALQRQDWHANETVWGQVLVSQQTHNAEGELTGAQADGTFYTQDRCVCMQSSSWSILPRDRYQRLREIARNRNTRRGDQPSEPVPLGPGFMVSLDSSARQPVLAPGLWVSSGGRRFMSTLQVDRSNLFFFDHDNDHVPGMLVLEGMRSMALDIVGKFRAAGQGPASLARIEVAFKNFAELDAPVQLVASITSPAATAVAPGEPMSLHIEARQFDRCFATGDFVAETHNPEAP